MNNKVQKDPRVSPRLTSRKDDKNIGILAFHGDIEEHQAAITSLGYTSKRIKYWEDLENLTHLIIPGGESTVVTKFFEKTDIDKEIIKRVKNKTLQVYGTCAGAILLANKVSSPVPIRNLGLIEATLSRNAYGSQIHSFETILEFAPTQEHFEAIFIRAPKIISFTDKVKVLCKHQNEPVMLEQENVLISTFHPELIRPAIIHQYFLNK